MSIRNRFKRLVNKLKRSSITIEERNAIEKQLGWQPLSSLQIIKKKKVEEPKITQHTNNIVADNTENSDEILHPEWYAQHKKIEEFYAKKPKKQKPSSYRQYMNNLQTEYILKYNEEVENNNNNTKKRSRVRNVVPAGHRNDFWYEYYTEAVEQFKSQNRKKIYNLDPSDPLYTEKHHIKPRCIGGTDDPDNFVVVSRDEHTTLHILLYLSHPSNNSLYKAAVFMINNFKSNSESIEDELSKQIFKETPTKQDKINKMENALLSMIKKNIVNIPESVITCKYSDLLDEDNFTGINYY